MPKKFSILNNLPLFFKNIRVLGKTKLKLLSSHVFLFGIAFI
jgi:hypothetical protein